MGAQGIARKKKFAQSASVDTLDIIETKTFNLFRGEVIKKVLEVERMTIGRQVIRRVH